VSRYRVEPYVVAADVYSASAHIGRGGWTWYTGSASWMYRLGLERILGLHRVENGLRLDPCIPRDWPAYEIAYRIHGSLYQIHVENPASVNSGVRQVEIDGEMLPGGEIPLLNDGKQHTVRVWMGQDTSARMSE
jgi:cellobiose phosphorylase